MKFDPKKTIFLIDGSSFLYRAYYGMRPLHTPKGEAVHAVYSFCRMIKKLINKFDPHYLVVVWDSKGKTTRHEMYEAYKATRQAPPSDLFEQKERILEFSDLIGLPHIAQSGIEADDIMYSIAKERVPKGNDIVLVTSDKDMAQMISDQVVMYDPMKEELIDTKAFKEKRGFPVKKLPFYFALLGDTSDNIPGVRGIGKKGAGELVVEFNSLKDLYENLDAVEKPRLRNALEAGRDNAFLSRDLFLLQYHPTHLHTKDLVFNPKNWSKARPLFEELNFKSLLKELPKISVAAGKQTSLFATPPAEKMAGYLFKKVVTTQQLDELCAELKQKKKFALDTETDGADPMRNACVGISFSASEDTAYYVPFAHIVDENQLSKEEVVAALKPILEDERYHKYLHNVKFDYKVLWRLGIAMRGIALDTVIAARLVLPSWQRVGLKRLSEFYFDEQMLTFNEVVKQQKLKNFAYVSLDLATRYSGSDSLQTFRLANILLKDLAKEKLKKLYNTVEHPLIEILAHMEITGIFCDTRVLEELDVKISRQLQAIEKTIIELAGEKYESINLNSPQQVEQLLFYDLKLPSKKKSAKGRYSTNVEVLRELTDLHPIPGLIMQYREYAKLKNTYIDALPLYINPYTGRIHTTYRQESVATGRLASSDPNLQNIPTNSSGYGLEIRAAFQANRNYRFISVDYSQIELRVLAQLSKDKTLVEAFLRGHDIHAQTAAGLFEIPLEQVTHEQRQIGKRINFSILYGLTPYGLSKDMGISFGQAKEYIQKYFDQYPNVSKWMDSVIEYAIEHGYVTTLWGRRRHVPGIYEQNRSLYEEARRVAINTVAQGTAAEIMKVGMIKLDAVLKKKKFDACMLLQIHDELLIRVHKDHVEAVEKIAKKELESAVDWDIPFVVTTRHGKDWKDVTK